MQQQLGYLLDTSACPELNVNMSGYCFSLIIILLKGKIISLFSLYLVLGTWPYVSHSVSYHHSLLTHSIEWVQAAAKNYMSQVEGKSVAT